MGTTGKFPDGSEGGTLSESIYDGCLEEGEESLMIGLIRALGAVALFVAMGLVNLAYADTFSPTAAPPEGTVTLTLEETVDWNPQIGSAYFLCDSGCGKTLLGAVKQQLNMQSFRKQYALTFNIPANAKPGSAYVEIGCDNCFENNKAKRKPTSQPTSQWRKVTGLQVLPPVTSRQDIITSYKFAFGRDPQEGEILFWQKQVKLSVDQLVANHRNNIKQVAATREEIIKRSFHEILKYEPSGMELHSWNNRLQRSGETYAELVDAHRKWLAQNPQPSPAPNPPPVAQNPQPSYADTFSPAAAPPGGTVTLAGQAKPNTSVSGYFSCNSECGQTHLGVATVNAQGRYSLTFKMPLGAKPGGAFVDIGCDGCGNNWRRVTGLQVQPALPTPINSSAGMKLYALDGTGAEAKHHNVIWHIHQRFQGEKQYFPGVTSLITADAYGIYQAVYTQVCDDVRARGVTKVFLIGYSRGAMTAIRVANDVRKNCGANVVFVGLLDAVSTLLPNTFGEWPRNLDSGVPVAVHVGKPSNSGAHVLGTEWVTGVATYYNPNKGGHFEYGAISHQQMACPVSNPENGSRWNEKILIDSGTKAGAKFSAPLADTNDC